MLTHFRTFLRIKSDIYAETIGDEWGIYIHGTTMERSQKGPCLGWLDAQLLFDSTLFAVQMEPRPIL